MEPPAFMLRPSEVQREGIVETKAEEDSNFAQPSRQGRQSGGPLVFAEPLNGAALDDNVERTWTHRRVQQVADDEFNASSWSMNLWTAQTSSTRIIGTRFCESHCDRRNVQCGHVETCRSERARLLRDTIARAQNGSQAVLGHHGSEQ